MRHGWSLSARCWEHLRVSLPMGEWVRAYLEPDYSLQVPRTAGIYLICGRPKDLPLPGLVMERLYNVIYTGQSNCLRRRFGEHLTGYRLVQNAKAIFRRLDFWYAAYDSAILDAAEDALINAFGPPANDRYVIARTGDPIPAGRPAKEQL